MTSTSPPHLYMDDATRAAFCATLYRFHSLDGEVLLKVNEPCPALRTFLQRLRAESMTVLTAFNPRGRRQDEALNHVVQQQLRNEISAAGWVLIPGRNEDPTGAWPAEDSLLVAGISLGDAHAIAARHHQLAFLWTDSVSATPRLMETAAA